jgi:hypothetical protein
MLIAKVVQGVPFEKVKPLLSKEFVQLPDGHMPKMGDLNSTRRNNPVAGQPL